MFSLPIFLEELFHRYLMKISILKNYLYSGFAEVQPHRKLLSCEDIRILSFLESSFELMQLVSCECRSWPPNFSRSWISRVIERFIHHFSFTNNVALHWILLNIYKKNFLLKSCSPFQLLTLCPGRNAFRRILIIVRLLPKILCNSMVSSHTKIFRLMNKLMKILLKI